MEVQCGGLAQVHTARQREWGFDSALKVSQQTLQLYEDGGVKVGYRGETLPWLVMPWFWGPHPLSLVLALLAVTEACPWR